MYSFGKKQEKYLILFLYLQIFIRVPKHLSKMTRSLGNKYDGFSFIWSAPIHCCNCPHWSSDFHISFPRYFFESWFLFCLSICCIYQMWHMRPSIASAFVPNLLTCSSLIPGRRVGLSILCFMSAVFMMMSCRESDMGVWSYMRQSLRWRCRKHFLVSSNRNIRGHGIPPGYWEIRPL